MGVHPKKWPLDMTQTVVLFMISTILLNIMTRQIVQLFVPDLVMPRDASFVNKIFLGVALVEFLFALRKTPLTFHLDALKINKECNFKREMAEAAVISAALIAGMVIYRLIMNGKNPEMTERPVFGLYLTIHGRWFYPISSVLQEFMIKGFVQDNLRSISPNQSRHVTVLINAMFFAILHMNYPLYYMLCAGLLCLFTGYLYERDRNIWGSVLIHFVIGFMPRALGLK